jgi:hypothetical protein
MRTLLASALCALTLSLCAAQPPKAGETIDYINNRLEHSTFMRVDDDGTARIATPSGILTFKLRDAAFNCNFQNGDDRVRIASDSPIELWHGSHREDSKHRQSFACRGASEAREAVQALRRLKAEHLGKDGYGALFNRRLAATEKDLPYATVGEAMDFVNDTLEASVVLKVDEKGTLTIQAPDTFYDVDLARAEFGLNDSSDSPRVRIYGDWCLDVYPNRRLDKAAARESFSTRSRHGARDVIKALYYLKGAFTGLTSESINALRNVSGVRTHEYTTIAQAVDAINDRLAISIILGVDAKGEVAVSIYRFNIQDCTFERPREEKHLLGLLHFRPEDGVNISAPRGLKKYEDGRFFDTVDDQTFSCRSDKDIPFIIRALEFIRSEARKGGAK